MQVLVAESALHNTHMLVVFSLKLSNKQLIIHAGLTQNENPEIKTRAVCDDLVAKTCADAFRNRATSTGAQAEVHEFNPARVSNQVWSSRPVYFRSIVLG